MLQVRLFLSCGVCIDRGDYLADLVPNVYVTENVHDTSSIGKGRALKDRQIFHQPVLYDILDDLVDKIYLPAVESVFFQILGKRGFCGSHVKPHDFPHELAEWLCAVRNFILFSRSQIAP